MRNFANNTVITERDGSAPVRESILKNFDNHSRGILEEERKNLKAMADEELVGRYAQKIHKLAYGITRGQRHAADIVQEVFLTLHEK